MHALSRRQAALGVSALSLLALGAGVAAAVVVTSGRASEVDLTSAALVPEDAVYFAGFNTDLGSSQWANAFGVVERLGQDNPRQQLEDSARDDGGLDWQKDVEPFLSGRRRLLCHQLRWLERLPRRDRPALRRLCPRTRSGARAAPLPRRPAHLPGRQLRRGRGGPAFLAVIGSHLAATHDEGFPEGRHRRQPGPRPRPLRKPRLHPPARRAQRGLPRLRLRGPLARPGPGRWGRFPGRARPCRVG